MAIKVEEKKKEIKLPEELNILFWIALFFLLLMGASYFIVSYFTQQVKKENVELEHQIEAEKAMLPEREEIEKTARNYSNLVEDFELVSSERRIASSFFAFLEEAIHPRVRVMAIRVEPEEERAVFSGYGEDFVAVGQQFRALENEELIKEVVLESVALDEREEELISVANFSFIIKLDPQLFIFD